MNFYSDGECFSVACFFHYDILLQRNRHFKHTKAESSVGIGLGTLLREFLYLLVPFGAFGNSFRLFFKDISFQLQKNEVK